MQAVRLGERLAASWSGLPPVIRRCTLAAWLGPRILLDSSTMTMPTAILDALLVGFASRESIVHIRSSLIKILGDHFIFLLSCYNVINKGKREGIDIMRAFLPHGKEHLKRKHASNIRTQINISTRVLVYRRGGSEPSG